MGDAGILWDADLRGGKIGAGTASRIRCAHAIASGRRFASSRPRSSEGSRLRQEGNGIGTAASEVSDSVVEAARCGDHAAFVAIVEHYDERLRRLAFHILGEPASVDDALQETYLKVYRSLPSFRGESALGTWLHRIVYTTCLNALRTHSRQAHPSETAPPERADPQADPAADVAQARDLAALLQNLSPQLRAAIVLIDVCDMSYLTAAGILGIPDGTLASRLARARDTLRRELESLGFPLAPSDTTKAPS